MTTLQKSKPVSLLILFGLIILLTSSVSYLLYDNFKKDEILSLTNSRIKSVEYESDSITIALQKEIEQLELLNKKYKELDAENVEVKNLIAQLIKEKESWEKRSKLNFNEISSLKFELSKTITDYDNQRVLMSAKIDSLIKKNSDLEVYTSGLKSSNDSLQKVSENQLQITERLLLKVSQLKAENLNIIVTNKSGKPTSHSPFKSNNVNTVSSVFNLSKNELATKGPKRLVMRIKKPDGGILYDISANGNTFTTASNLKYYYTVSDNVNFQNNYEQVTLTYHKQDELSSGKYQINIFLDGVDIGSTSFDIK